MQLIHRVTTCYRPTLIMLVFLLCAVPLSFLLLVALMGAGNLPQKVLLTPTVRGGLFALGIYPLLDWIEGTTPVTYEVWPLFLRYGAFHAFGVVFLAVIGILWLCRWLFAERSTDLFIGLAAFFAGYFTVFGILEVVFPVQYPSIYDAFLLPAIRIAMMLLVAGCLTAARHERLILKVSYLLLAVLSTAIAALVVAVFVLRYSGFAVGLTLGLSVVAVGITYLLQAAYFRSFL